MSANASTAASIILLKKKAVFLTIAPILNQAVCAVSVWLSMYEQPTPQNTIVRINGRGEEEKVINYPLSPLKYMQQKIEIMKLFQLGVYSLIL